ncbi:hypothetical protein HS088_TW18G00301 [Tripterygium wilfordii]|uniref:SWIM-type domain-containing protein n=1 Tax=Tripterygium wilfordii TaxID=458696 RepID=A0A7J7CBW8_TRIWF|nr:uncharacterized protein LOC119984739 [Tripterygium wilfordii]KAF5731619.1 hypothetical protein HS088_TW18G00301 [Tripterygium wilfordii]
MARWDEIFSLPVQNPPNLEFSSAELVWSKVEGWRDKLDRVALIPFSRVDDFVRGEAANKDCPSRFHVEARRRRPSQMPYKAKVDGILEYILYWCSFGPDDHRKGGTVRPSRSTYIPKKKNAGRPNTKRGCTCHFIVKRLIAEPSVALIVYNHEKHVDKKGIPCHGALDKMAAGTRAMFAPYISEDLRLRVLSLLHVGVSVETIMQRHNEFVDKQGGPCNRDDLLTHRYVRRQERSIRRSKYELDPDDAVSISMWVESHQSHVFFFKDFSDSDPFTLGIQTEWQLQQMIRFGNCNLVASDSRFGTNKLKYPIHSLIVFNSDNKAIPVAWIITPRFSSADTHKWMMALYNRIRAKDPTWKLAGFIVDDPSADVLTIRDVFQCSVLISFWRVRREWQKNLLKRCSGTQMSIQIAKRLGEVVDDICRGNGTVDLFNTLMEDFVDASDFMDYFKAIWYPRLGIWTTALKTIPLASQETCAALEFYHNQLKLRLLNEKDPGVYQRADWLVDKLGTKVHSYFWLDEYSGKDDFARYWKDEWISGLTSWRKALKISDSDVVVEGRCAKITDHCDRNITYIVWNPGSEFAICNCTWAEMGNLCEHVIKLIKLFRDKGHTKPSITMFQYNRTLFDTLFCSPHDSVFRDHAVSLAVSIQKQLGALVDLESSHTTANPTQKLAEVPIEQQTSNQDRELVSENDFMDEDVPSQYKNACAGGNDGCEDSIGDIHSGSANGTGIETDGEEGACAEMDIDPFTICISPASLVSVDEGVSGNLLSENADVVTDIGDNGGRITILEDDAFTNKNCFEEGILSRDSFQTMKYVKLPANDAPASATEFLEQCMMTHQDSVCSTDAGPSKASSTADAADLSDNTSPFPVQTESKVAEPSGAIIENQGTQFERENVSLAKDHFCTDGAISFDGVSNEKRDCSNGGHDMLHSESLPKQPLVSAGDEEAASCEKLSSSDKSVLSVCELQEGVKSDNADNADANNLETGGSTVSATSCIKKPSLTEKLSPVERKL